MIYMHQLHKKSWKTITKKNLKTVHFSNFNTCMLLNKNYKNLNFYCVITTSMRFLFFDQNYIVIRGKIM
jgi:hypothetical protein